MSINVGELMNLDDLSGIEEGHQIEPFETKDVSSDYDNRDEDLKKDYGVIRNNLNIQSQMGMEALRIALENARNSDAPRQMEVFATLLGQITNLNESVVKIHKQLNDNEPKQSTTINADGASIVFQGTPYDLQSRIGSQSDVRREKVVNENNKT